MDVEDASEDPPLPEPAPAVVVDGAAVVEVVDVVALVDEQPAARANTASPPMSMVLRRGRVMVEPPAVTRQVSGSHRSKLLGH
jgi:hypothetical protein